MNLMMIRAILKFCITKQLFKQYGICFCYHTIGHLLALRKLNFELLISFSLILDSNSGPFLPTKLAVLSTMFLTSGGGYIIPIIGFEDEVSSGGGSGASPDTCNLVFDSFIHLWSKRLLFC